ncbi:hypothetical protein ACWKSP_14720 [Micromonosporaceae bacterium Da 78-11]
MGRPAHRLQLRGFPVSPASLSYWSRGLRVPECPESLEEVLRVQSGSLLSLLTATRCAAVRAGSGRCRWTSCGGDDEGPVSRVLVDVGAPYDGRRTISLHDRYTVDGHDRKTTSRVTTVIEAVTDDVDRVLVIYLDDTGGRRKRGLLRRAGAPVRPGGRLRPWVPAGRVQVVRSDGTPAADPDRHRGGPANAARRAGRQLRHHLGVAVHLTRSH